MLKLYRRGANRIRFQARTCTTNNCSSASAWFGTDGTDQSAFTEANNNSVQVDAADLSSSDKVIATAPKMNFANFTSLSVANSQYFQYRAIMESDDASTNCSYSSSNSTWCSPELQTVMAGPNHYDPTSPTLINKTTVAFTGLKAMNETLDTNGCSGSNTSYALSSDNSTYYYWNGTAWAVATAAQSNTATVINTNASTFTAKAGAGNIYFKAFLNSTGTTACELKNVEIQGTN